MLPMSLEDELRRLRLQESLDQNRIKQLEAEIAVLKNKLKKGEIANGT